MMSKYECYVPQVKTKVSEKEVHIPYESLLTVFIKSIPAILSVSYTLEN